MTKRRIAVLGAGSWGTSLAIALAHNQHPVALWCRSATHAAQMNQQRMNQRYLNGISFPESLVIHADMSEALSEISALCVVVPSHSFAATIQHVAEIWASQRIDPSHIDTYWGTKGFDPATGNLLDQAIARILGDNAPRAVVSGPTFAREVALLKPSALTVAGNTQQVALRVADDLRSAHLRVYTNRDITGVQLGGVIKNVIAIATGISDGLEMGANARAALLTRGLSELTRLGLAMGGEAETLAGLSGVGDLVLTCTDDQSRNRRVGLGIGAGRSLADVTASIGQEAEGINTSRILYEKSEALGIDMPIVTAVFQVLFNNLSPTDAMKSLMTREARDESI